MHVLVELFRAHRTEEVELPVGSTGFDLFRKLQLAPDAHLLVRGGSPLPLDEPLNDAEQLLVISVVSGGS